MDPIAFLSSYLFFCILDRILPSKRDNFSILDVGSYDVNGNLRDIIKTSMFSSNRNYSYVGMDRVSGPNVDIVFENDWPVMNETFDIVISSSCFEHDDFFWETFLLLSRSLTPGGWLHITVPSTGSYHGYPGDNWRFYNDSAVALTKWANKNKEDMILIHSSTIPHNQTDPYRGFGMTNMIFMKGLPSSTKESHMDISEYSKAFANYRYDLILASNRYLNLFHSLPVYEMLFQLPRQEQYEYERRAAHLKDMMKCQASIEISLDCTSILASDQFTYDGMYPSTQLLRFITSYCVSPKCRMLQLKYIDGYPLEYQSNINIVRMPMSILSGQGRITVDVLIPLSLKGLDHEIETFSKNIILEFLSDEILESNIQAVKHAIHGMLNSIP